MIDQNAPPAEERTADLNLSNTALPLRSRVKLGLWLWIYALSRLLLDPILLVRTYRSSPNPLRVALLGIVVPVGFLAAILLVRRRPVALQFVSADLLLRVVMVLKFYWRLAVHPLHPSRDPRFHSAFMLLITLGFGIAPICLWFLYFNQSRRVRELLGSNLCSWLIPPSPHET